MSILALVAFILLTVLTFLYARYLQSVLLQGAIGTAVLTAIGFGFVIFLTARYVVSPDEMNIGLWFIVAASFVGTWWDKISARLFRQ